MTDETLKENTTHGKAERACKQCGADMHMNAAHNAKYCGSFCKHKAAYIRRHPDNKPFSEDRSCIVCGAWFDAKTVTRKYCGRNCRGAQKLEDGREKNTKRARGYRRKHPDRYREYDRARRDNPLHAMRMRISSIHRYALRRVGDSKRKPALEALGYTADELVAHLERQFTRGMGWHNMGKWHIDHIVPISTAETEADVIALNQLSNLRPLWARDNLAKSDKRTHLI